VTDTEFTAEPGHVRVFNVIVDRNPRGKVKSVACGHDFMLVATSSYDGPDEDEVDCLQDDEIVREEAKKRKVRMYRLLLLLLTWSGRARTAFLLSACQQNMAG
jgi:hypothetical protein